MQCSATFCKISLVKLCSCFNVIRKFVASSYRCFYNLHISICEEVYTFAKRKSIEIEKIESKRRIVFDYIARAGNCPLFTDAIPLLPGAGIFACCVATLGRYVPHYRTWAHQNSFSVTMLTSGLVRTPDLHRQTATSDPELKPFNDSNLQAAGLQVHATTPGDR